MLVTHMIITSGFDSSPHHFSKYNCTSSIRPINMRHCHIVMHYTMRLICQMKSPQNNNQNKQIVLETEYDNYAALSLYESLGFIREKRLYRFYLNGKDAFRLVLAMPTDGSSSDDDDERSHLPPMMRSSKFRRHMARRVIRISAYDDDDEDDVSGR